LEPNFPDGAREAHAVATDDWPVIRKLRDSGKLSYADDEVRAGMDEIAQRGLVGAAAGDQPPTGRVRYSVV